METNVLIEKVETLPNDLKKEVEDFVDFLIYKNENYNKVLIVKEESPGYSYHKDSLEFNTKIRKPIFGSGKGLFGKIADDFDEPLDEMKDYM